MDSGAVAFLVQKGPFGLWRVADSSFGTGPPLRGETRRFPRSQKKLETSSGCRKRSARSNQARSRIGQRLKGGQNVSHEFGGRGENVLQSVLSKTTFGGLRHWGWSGRCLFPFKGNDRESPKGGETYRRWGGPKLFWGGLYSQEQGKEKRIPVPVPPLFLKRPCNGGKNSQYQ